MDEMTNFYAIEDERFEDPGIPLSRAGMFLSFILIICGLLLSSTLFFVYGMQAKDLDPHTALTTVMETYQTRDPFAPVQSAQAPIMVSNEPDTASRFTQKTRQLFKSDTIHWPRLTVTGFGSTSDGSGGFAIINGDQVMLNNYIDDVKLIEVHEHSILVEYKGERKTLTSGNH